MKKAASRRPDREQLKEIRALAARPEDQIDLSDAPERTDWSGAKRGLFYRPLKQQLTLRLDADVLAWFRHQATDEEGYQTRINRVLREYVRGQQSGRKAKTA
ncbi:MAG: BrnA antitoxin family protein [Dongiaceae bacterium]